jgi:plastocyanin
LYTAAAIIIVVVIAVGVMAAYPASSPPPAAIISINMYSDRITHTTDGFGTVFDNITSPGPPLTFEVGDMVNVTFRNFASKPHNWAIVTEKSDGNTSLAFGNAQIGSVTNPIYHEGIASTTFTVDKTGTFYYICQDADHVTLGMWGTVTVTG